MKQCEWLVSNQESDGSWRIEHKNPKFEDLPSPWPSALSQGLAVSALLRAFRYSRRKEYLESAKSAASFLERDVSENGVRRVFEKEGVSGFVYEEYPVKSLSGVLNGYISAVLAIEELSREEPIFVEVLGKNMENLLTILPLYDTGYWSLYSLDGEIDSGFYHRLVTMQLRVLAETDGRFAPFAERFERYGESFLSASRALYMKIRSRV